jgi:sarcosine oxidase
LGLRTEYDDIIIGLGGIGSAAAYWLSRRKGRRVLGLEQFEIGHVRGESQDHSRIIRLSYHRPHYVELAKHAYKAWAVLEKEAGKKLIVRTGGLDLSPEDSMISLSDYSNSMKAANVPFERLDAVEIMRRWPQWHLPNDVRGVYQKQSGIAPAAKCNATHISMARKQGAVLLEKTPVKSIRIKDTKVEVAAKDATYHAQNLIIAAGPWTNGVLAHLGLRLPLTVTQEQVTYFATLDRRSFIPSRFPVWIWNDEPCFYGFPIYGENGVKVGQDVGGKEVTATTRTFETDAAALGRVERFLMRYLPTAVGPIIYTKTCLYTLTPDRDFIIDTIPEYPNISVAVGAGHGFKFASLIGKILGELAVNQNTRFNIRPYRIDRPILREKNPKKNFMV